MKQQSLLATLVALVIAAVVIPAYAHQSHGHAVSELIVAQPTTPSRTAEVAIYVTGRDGRLETSVFRIDIPANDLEDAHNRFLHDHLVDGIYQFISREHGEDHLYLIERNQVVRTEIVMK